MAHPYRGPKITLTSSNMVGIPLDKESSLGTRDRITIYARQNICLLIFNILGQLVQICW